MNPDILLIEDEAALRNMLAFSLERVGMRVHLADSAEDGMMRLESNMPDLILLDWMLPGMDGLQFVRALRQHPHHGRLPVIMLTARGSERDRTLGLETGADDYLVKPFSVRELIARIRAILRRRQGRGPDESERIELDGLVLEVDRHRVLADRQPVPIGPTEFRLLKLMMGNVGRAWRRQQILEAIWGRDDSVAERTVDVHIRRLRKALEPSGYNRFIQTIRGYGYRFSSLT